MKNQHTELFGPNESKSMRIPCCHVTMMFGRLKIQNNGITTLPEVNGDPFES